MPSKIAYIVCRKIDGTMRSVTSTSPRAAMVKFFMTYKGMEEGEDFWIKVRGEKEWLSAFRYHGGGAFRKIGLC